MPIYEYQCEECGNKFEKLVRRAAEAADMGCPSCGQKHVTQQFSTFAARANGSQASQSLPACPGGMCRTPDVCGRN
ncbi:MAG: zinc ribbon domain-containing protein [Candidatus Solibacter usitatus]|nr:zinc ribbon domain-containing protein [Candidatus Solibacter usitatus]